MSDYDYTITKAENECRYVGKTRRAMWQSSGPGDYFIILVSDTEPTVETWINQMDKADSICQSFVRDGEYFFLPTSIPEHWHNPKAWAAMRRESAGASD